MGDFVGISGLQGAASTGPSRTSFHEQLLDRKARLAAIPRARWRAEFHALLHEVDAALERLGTGNFGICEDCHEPIEPARLTENPLARVCLACLSDSEQRALEHDLELAAVIQRALLPAERIHVPGWEIEHRYRPLGPVSGDYCDVFRPEAPGGPTHFVLGDVSGKGVSASILMAHLQAVFRSLASLGLPLADLAQRANRILCDGTVSSSFSTLLLGRLSVDGTLDLCNAGHCPPLLVRRGTTTPLPATGMPLGLFCESAFQVTRVDLSQGDALLLYTDGLSEATDGRHGSYGSERLARFARGLNGQPTGEALEGLLHDVDLFRNGTAMEDDLTVMIVRRVG